MSPDLAGFAADRPRHGCLPGAGDVVALNAAGPANVGTSSAINNMVAARGGLIAIAVFGLILAHGYNASLLPAFRPRAF